MDALLIVINILLILNAIILIISVLMQEGSRQGLGVIAGGAETFFGKSKGKSYEGKLEMITKVGVATFIVLAIVMTAINARSGISNVEPADLSEAPSVSEILDQKKSLEGDGLDTTLPIEEAPVEETPVDEAPVEESETTEELAATEQSAAIDEVTEPEATPAA